MKQCKPKPCRSCKQEFQPRNSLMVVCGLKCAISYENKKNEAKARAAINKQRKSDRTAIRARKQALKSKPDWLREAQAVFNKFIRERDKDNDCISCGKPPKKKNAGHYKSVGAYPELRYNEYNCHLQCEHCNTFKSGNATEYRLRLVEKIGLKNVQWIEGKHVAQNYTIDDIKEIKQYYQQKIKGEI